MPDLFTPSNAAQTAKIDKLLLQLEEDTLDDIVRRLAKAGKVTSSADWQINRLHFLGNGSQDIQAKLQAASGKTAKEMAALYAGAAQETYTRDKDLYTATGKSQVAFNQNLELQQMLRGITTQTAGTIENITRSTGFMIKDPATGQLKFTSTSDIYNSYLDRNIMAMLSGAQDYNTMIRKTVSELTASGLRSIDYASGRSSRIDVAVRRALLTGYAQVTSQVTFSNASDLGTELFEVSWHPDARPDHQLWQGKVYTRKELETKCGYGSVTGLCGANCRHTFYPYVKGVSRRQWSDAKLAALNAAENAPKNYKGKDYTDYEATQQQRRYEANMRAYRERIQLLEAAYEANPDEALLQDITLNRAKLRALAQQYREFSDFFGLPEQWERVYTGGYTIPPHVSGGIAGNTPSGPRPNGTKTPTATFAGTKGLTDEFRKGMAEALAKSEHEAVRRIYQKYEDRLVCKDDKYKGGAHYSHAKGGVFFNAEAGQPYRTAFHEFGHMIDYLIGTSNNEGRVAAQSTMQTVGSGWDITGLKGVLKKDYKAYKQKEGITDDKDLILHLKGQDVKVKNGRRATTIKGANVPATARGDISDTLEGLTGISYPLGRGHGAAYHERPGASEKEFFAEVLDAAANNQASFEWFEKLFPGAVQMVFDIIEEDLAHDSREGD